MNLKTLALAALVAFAAPALAQTPPAKAEPKKENAQDKAAKTDKKADPKAATKTETSPKK